MAFTDYYVRADAVGGGTGLSNTSGDAFTWAELTTRMNAGAAAAGDRYNVKAGTYSLSASSTFSNDGTTASPIVIRGFNSTPGDLDEQGRIGGTGDLDTTNFPSIEFGSTYRFAGASATLVHYMNLKFTGAPNATLADFGSNCFVHQVYADNTSTGANAVAIAIDSNSVVATCDGKLSGGSGGLGAFRFNGSPGTCLDCRCIMSSNHGFLGLATVGMMVCVGCVAANCGGDGFAYTGTTAGSNWLLINCTSQGNTGNGVSHGNAAFTYMSRFINCMVTDNGGYGFKSNYSGTAQLAAVFLNCRTRDNTSGISDGFTDWKSSSERGAVTIDTGGEETDYTNAGSDDYSLISTSPAKGAGIPTNIDIGALQRQETGGSNVIVVEGD